MSMNPDSSANRLRHRILATARLSVFARLVSVALVCLLATGTATAVDIVALEELRPGDRCVARTVFRGTEIEEFEIEILDVVPGHHPGGSIILGLARGEVVERTGIMQGMSGSPVYLDGRLVGAVAMSWSFSREPIAGITPIEEMLPAFEMLEERTGDAGGVGVSYAAAFDRATRGELSGSPIRRLVELAGLSAISHDSRGGSDGSRAGPAPLLAPLLVRSSDRVFLDRASELLEPLGFAPVTGWGGGSGAGRPAQAISMGDDGGMAAGTIEPGASVGAQLVTGDIDMTAIGTVTHLDGDRLLAFGHPLFNAGAVELPMVAARVHASMPSLAVSFKFASGAEHIGAFLQDRRRVMAGRLGASPHMLPVTAMISVDGAAPTRYEFEVVRSPAYASLFTGLALSDAVAEAARLSGPATAELHVTASTAGGAVDYANVFYTEGLPYRVGGEVSSVVDLLLLNEFRESDLEGVSVELRVRSGRRQSFIERVSAGRPVCSPGDTVDVRVALRDWQGESREHALALVVPRSAEPGPVLLRVAGGADHQMLEIERLGAGALPRSFEQMTSMIEEVRSEDTVVVQLLSFTPGLSHSGRELEGLPRRAALVMAAGAATGTVDRAEMTVLDAGEFTHDRPVAGVHEVQLTIIDDTDGAR